MADVYHVLVIPWEIPHLCEAANMGISAAQICTSDLSDWLQVPCLAVLENPHQPLLAKPPYALTGAFLLQERSRLKMS